MNNDTIETTVEKTLFTLPDHGKEDTPICLLHFYGWMKEKKVADPHKILTKKEYLDEIGFNKEVHTLGETWEDDLHMINGAMDMYYQWEILKKSENSVLTNGE